MSAHASCVGDFSCPGDARSARRGCRSTSVAAIAVIAAIALALIGVINQIVAVGTLPVLALFLAVTFVVMAILTVLTKHLVLPGTVNDANVGWWERLYAIVLVGWVGVAAWVLDRKLLHHATVSPPQRPASAALDVPI